MSAGDYDPGMKILFLGGTGFLGPHTVRAALAAGHDVTLFNRGKSNADLFEDEERVTKLVGDRNDDLTALEEGTWDVAIDVHAHIPRWVRTAAEALQGKVEQFVFVSSCSVYTGGEGHLSEDAETAVLPDGTPEEPYSNAKFGALKALCEQAALEAFPGRSTVVRPGLIVGPGDYSDRFTYWPVRVQRGGEVMAPGNPEFEVQFVDVRDLGAFLVKLVEDGHVGIYNSVGYETPLSFEAMLHGCHAVTGGNATFTWVPDDFLLEQGAGPWMEVPLWIPPAYSPSLYANAKAVSVGHSFRPLAETVRDTLDYADGRPDDYQWRAGMAAEKEAEILAAWHAEQDED